MPGTNFPNGIKTRINDVDKTVTGNATIASVVVADAVASVAAPTKAEFDAVVALANSNKAQLNLVILTLKNAGIIL